MKASLFDLFLSALSTREIILDTVLSPKLLVVRTRTTPERLMQPDMIVSPSFKSRGILSPVRAMVFKAELPSTTIPSNGTFSPGRITIVSPILTSSGETDSTFRFFQHSLHPVGYSSDAKYCRGSFLPHILRRVRPPERRASQRLPPGILYLILGRIRCKVLR